MDVEADTAVPFPIIDSHIHLYAGSHLQDLAWAPSLPDGHVLKQQNSVNQYRAVTKLQPNLKGFVFVETDRKSSLSKDGWKHALEEVNYLRRIKAGMPKEGEGHTAEDKPLLLGVVAWAPLGAPLPDLQKYVDRALEPEDGLIKGFRYLLQDKPVASYLKPEFIDGLLLLEKAGAKTFDLGVDYRQGGRGQLTAANEMLNEFHHKSTGALKIVINHFCKPNLGIEGIEGRSEESDFSLWHDEIAKMSELSCTYMKLSGFFSELPPQSKDDPTSIRNLSEQTRPYIDVVFCLFRGRVMFGSDWPVCNVGGPGPSLSWQHWVNLVSAVLDEQELTDAEKAHVWAGCANEVYGLGIDLSR